MYVEAGAAHPHFSSAQSSSTALRVTRSLVLTWHAVILMIQAETIWIHSGFICNDRYISRYEAFHHVFMEAVLGHVVGNEAIFQKNSVFDCSPPYLERLRYYFGTIGFTDVPCSLIATANHDPKLQIIEKQRTRKSYASVSTDLFSCGLFGRWSRPGDRFFGIFPSRASSVNLHYSR